MQDADNKAWRNVWVWEWYWTRDRIQHYYEMSKFFEEQEEMEYKLKVEGIKGLSEMGLIDKEWDQTFFMNERDGVLFEKINWWDRKVSTYNAFQWNEKRKSRTTLGGKLESGLWVRKENVRTEWFSDPKD